MIMSSVPILDSEFIVFLRKMSYIFNSEQTHSSVQLLIKKPQYVWLIKHGERMLQPYFYNNLYVNKKYQYTVSLFLWFKFEIIPSQLWGIQKV